MAQVQFASRIDSKLKSAITRTCKERGLKISRLVQDALYSYLEEIEDQTDVKHLRYEPRSPLSDVIQRLNLHGKV